MTLESSRAPWQAEPNFETRWGLASYQTLEEKRETLAKLEELLEEKRKIQENVQEVGGSEQAKASGHIDSQAQRLSQLQLEIGQAMGLPKGETGMELQERYVDLLRKEIEGSE
ncbi:MAG: hypothetical protein QG585_595 [Patescibacteria group bacterium]|jgi:hypothetical protein|nr:hypothetical protein [Patescibacteria group bacterium]